jgi:hypothetical protein
VCRHFWLLKSGLDEIKTLLKKTKFEVTDEQLEIANKRIDFLIEAPNRLTKSDWKGIVLSTFIGISIDLLLDEKKNYIIWTAFKNMGSYGIITAIYTIAKVRLV